MEFLRCAAVDLPVCTHGALGSLWTPRNDAQIWSLGISLGLVVGRGESCQSAATVINPMILSRRGALSFFTGAAATVSSSRVHYALAQASDRHGMSAFGDLKYPPDFPHFSYVNPNAPK